MWIASKELPLIYRYVFFVNDWEPECVFQFANEQDDQMSHSLPQPLESSLSDSFHLIERMHKRGCQSLLFSADIALLNR